MEWDNTNHDKQTCCCADCVGERQQNEVSLQRIKSFRTKPSVAAGITARADHVNVIVIEYEPGNGTRYALVFSQIPLSAARDQTLGTWRGNDTIWMIALSNCHPKNRIMFVDADPEQADPLDWRTVNDPEDGFGIGFNDSVILAELIPTIIGAHGRSSEEMTAEVYAMLGPDSED